MRIVIIHAVNFLLAVKTLKVTKMNTLVTSIVISTAIFFAALSGSVYSHGNSSSGSGSMMSNGSQHMMNMQQQMAENKSLMAQRKDGGTSRPG